MASSSHVTFPQFVASCTFVECLDDTGIAYGVESPGFVYLDSFYIEKQTSESVDREGNPQTDTDFVVSIGNTEASFGDDLEAAEKYLWDEFAFLESNCGKGDDFPFERVGFYFSDDPTFEGFADGTTWNGFDNVRVTEKVHKQVVAYFTEQAERFGVDLDDALESFAAIEPDEFRLYDYGNGFATSIDEDHYHAINR